MLPRSALRSIPLSRSPSAFVQYGLSAGVAFSRVRAYASSNSKSSKSTPPSAATKPSRPPPQPKPFVSPSAQARQTPKDSTWKPKDGVKFSAAKATAGTATPIQGSRPEVKAAATPSPLDTSGPSKEPFAQKYDADEPVPNSSREQAQDNLAQSENTPAPQEASENPSQTLPPLPDLRQGLPSTFDIEFGSGRQSKSSAAGADAGEAQDDKLNVTSPRSENPRDGREGRDSGPREEREYDNAAYETSIDRKRQQYANYLFITICLAAGLGAAYLARPYSGNDDLPQGLEPEFADGWAPGKMYARIRARFGSQLGYYTEPIDTKLLPDIPESQRAPYTLVLSLEDLLIHTSWDTKHGYRVAKRPGVDYFIRYLSQYYELVLFTSEPKAIAEPVIAKLDPYHFLWPLGREATKFEKGEIVKDLSYLNRPLPKTLIIDTKAGHVRNQPENAILLPKWNGDPKDAHTKDLVALIPFLEYVATMGTEDVRTVVKSFEGQSIPEEFARREAEARKRFQEQLAAERSRKPRYSLGSVASSLGVKGGAGMGGGMVLADGQSVAAGLAQGKMLSDQIREQGQKQYEALEKQIRENGAQWLKDEAEENKRLTENHMKEMKQNTLSWFGGGSSKGA